MKKTNKKNAEKTIEKTIEKTVDFNIPETPDTWDKVAMLKTTPAQTKAIKGLPEFKGFQVWLAPFKTPDKPFRVVPENDLFIIHIVTWGKRFIARKGENSAKQIAEIQQA
jgi:hypothetical protein